MASTGIDHGASKEVTAMSASKESLRSPVQDDGDDSLSINSGIDKLDMNRMGKEQQFRRIFRQSTMIMFTSLVQASWETVVLASAPGLANGGLAGLFWGYIWTFIGFFTIVMSLAEMASMAPTSGGQYHWVSEFAPRKYQKFLSYMSGWMSVLSWQASTASGSFIIGTLIQATLIAYRPSYAPKPWQSVLFVMAASAIELVINTVLASQLPRIQKLMVVPHALGWIAVIIVLWVLAPHASARQVFLTFSSNGGWEPLGLSTIVGAQVTCAYYLILSDTAAHLSEEVKTASKSVPRAMLWSYVLNGSVGFIVLIAFLFAIPDINTVLDPVQNPSGFAIIYILKQCSDKGAIPIIVVLLLVCITGVSDSNASTSRQIFAFARDGGLPFKGFLSKVARKTVPQNAVFVTCTITVLLSLIILGSSIAFNAIISLQLLALMATYCISIGCVLYQRIANGGIHLPPRQWDLGRYGIYINAVAFTYAVFVMFWVPWPPNKQTPFDAKSFNWSIVVFGAVLVFSLVYYLVHGKKKYAGPVVLVRQP